MKTNTKNLENCQVELKVALDAEEMKGVVKEVEKAFMREARLPGFRPGKVPIDIIRRQFADALRSETQNEMVRRHYNDAVKAEGVEEVALVGLKDVSSGAEGGEFTAVVDVKPKFKLPAYKGLKIAQNDTKVSDQQVSDQLERLRAAYAKFEDAKEGEAVSDGDFVQIDYSGTVDGKPVLEVSPEAKVVASGTGFWFQVEEGRFLPEIVEAVKGMKVGETKAGVKARFAKEGAPEGLGGKDAEYSVTLKMFRRRILPGDAEFAEKAKAESVEKLSATIREALEKQAIDAESARRENEAVEMLMKKVDFAVPQSQVRRAMDGVLSQFEQRAQYSGLPADYFEKNRDQILKDAEDTATRQVRLWYVFDAIAKAENIEAKDEEKGKKVVELILANAKG